MDPKEMIDRVCAGEEPDKVIDEAVGTIAKMGFKAAVSKKGLKYGRKALKIAKHPMTRQVVKTAHKSGVFKGTKTGKALGVASHGLDARQHSRKSAARRSRVGKAAGNFAGTRNTSRRLRSRISGVRARSSTAKAIGSVFR